MNYKLSSLLNVRGMVNVKHLGEGKGQQTAAVADECPLEVAHALLATLYAAVQRSEGILLQSVDAGGDKLSLFREGKVERGEWRVEREGRNVIESCYLHSSLSTFHSGNCPYPQRFLVIYEVGHAHQPVSVAQAEGPDVVAELRFPENGIYRGQHKGPAMQIRTNLVEAVHAAGRALHHEAQGHRPAVQPVALHGCQMLSDLCHTVVADDNNLLSVVVHKNADEPVNESLAPYPDQWFRQCNALMCKARALASRNNCIFHGAKVINNSECKKHRAELFLHPELFQMVVAAARQGVVQLAHVALQRDVAGAAQVCRDGAALGVFYLHVARALQHNVRTSDAL